MSYKEKPFRLCLRFQDCDVERKEIPFFRAVFNALGIKQDSTEAYGKWFDGNTQLLNFGFDDVKSLNDAASKIRTLLQDNKKPFEEVKPNLRKTKATHIQMAISFRLAAPLMPSSALNVPAPSFSPSLLRRLGGRLGLQRFP